MFQLFPESSQALTAPNIQDFFKEEKPIVVASWWPAFSSTNQYIMLRGTYTAVFLKARRGGQYGFDKHTSFNSMFRGDVDARNS
eukprot:1159471-Pelagomonas_calceolata.AAC.8